MEGDTELLNITLNSSDEEQTTKPPPRDHQSASAFQAQKQSWKPKYETGEIWKTLRFPLVNPSKAEGQKVLYAIEELYFLRRYGEAVRVAERALDGEIGAELRERVRGYRERCVAKRDAEVGEKV